MATRKLTVNIDHIDPRDGDTFGYQISNNGSVLTFPSGSGWDKTFVTEDAGGQEELLYIGKFNSDLSIDNIYAGFNGNILDSATQTDGKLIVVGDFDSYNGIYCPRICRFNTDGTFDPIPNITTGPNGSVKSINLGSGNEIYIGGDFTVVNGVSVNRICRLSNNGTVNTTFVNNVMSAASSKGFNGSVNVIANGGGGTIFVGGRFTNFNSIPRNRIIKLFTNGTEDTSFVEGGGFSRTVSDVNTEVNTFFYTDGGTRLMVGGNFNKYKVTTNCNNVVKLQLNGTLDGLFLQGAANTGTNGTVNAIRTDDAGNIFIGGTFTFYGVVPRAGLVKTTNNGVLIDLFDDGFNMGGSVNDIRFNGSDIVVAGSMIGYNGVVCGNVVTMNSSSGDIIDNLRLNAAAEEIQISGSDITVVGRFTQYTVSGSDTNSFYTIPLAEDVLFNGSFVISGGGYTRTGGVATKYNDKYYLTSNTTYNETGSGLFIINLDGELVYNNESHSLDSNDFQNNSCVLNDGSIILLTPSGELVKLDSTLNTDTSFNSGSSSFDSSPSIDETVLKYGIIPNNDKTEFIIGVGDFSGLYNGEDFSGLGPFNGHYLIIDENGNFISNGEDRSYVKKLRCVNDDLITVNYGSSARSTKREGTINWDLSLHDTQDVVELDNGNIVFVGGFNGPFGSGNVFSQSFGTASYGLAIINDIGTELIKFNSGSGFDSTSFINKVFTHNDSIYINTTSTTTYNGVTLNGLVRFNSDLELDTTFSCSFSGESQVNGMLFENTSILITGRFTSINGESVSGITHIDYNGNVIDTVPNLPQTIQNTYDNLTEFNSGSGITYSIDGDNVIMEYEFDEEEIVVESLFDTPDHVELTTTNESLTINELIEEVLVRSPYLIISEQADFSHVDYSIKIFEGEFFSEPSQSIAYELTKQKLFSDQENVYININNLVRENLEASPFTFLDNELDAIKPTSPNISKWVHVTEDYVDYSGSIIDTRIVRLLATDGFLYNDEFQGIPNVLMTGDERIVDRNQSQRVYFQSNFLDGAIKRTVYNNGFANEVNLTPIDNLLLDNTLYIQSLKIDTTDENAKHIVYEFNYTNSSTVYKTFNIVNSNCKYDFYNLIYKNKWGVLESLPLSKKTTKSINISSDNLKRSILDYNGSYNINRHTSKQFNTKAREEWVLNTDWLPEYMNQAIEEAMLSEEVWLLDISGIVIPVIRKDNNFTYKTNLNDKLIQYTIRVELSHDKIKNIL